MTGREHKGEVALLKEDSLLQRGDRCSQPRHTRSLKVCLFAALAALAIAALPAQSLGDVLGEFLGRRVVSVEVVIEQARGGNLSEIKALLDVEPGQEYSPVRNRDSLARLHRSGLVSGARVEAQPVGSDGVALTFIVKPQARIETILFEGSPLFAASDLRVKLTQPAPGDRLSEGVVKAGLSELLGFYSSEGYYQAQISHETRLDPTGTRATVAYIVNPGARARVARITRDVRGEMIDQSRIKHALSEGNPFSQSALDEEIDAVKRAYLEQNYLAVRLDSSVAVDMIDNTVSVTIKGESGPKVTVAVDGLDIGEKKLRELLPFYLHGGIDDFSLEEGRRRLLDYAQRQGYFFAEVHGQAAADLSSPAVELRYVVERGARYILKDIDIEGLTAIPSAELQLQMKSKQATIPLFGLGRGVTSDDMLRQDANLILKRLREAGYRRAQVEVRRGVSVTGEDLFITFDVKEGPRTYVEQVALRGNNVLSEEELRRNIQFVEANPLTAGEVARSTDHLLGIYSARGYATAEVVSELVELGAVDGQDRVRLIYNVAEGNRARIRKINTRGAVLTNKGRLHRDFYMFHEGDRLRADRIQETERALYDTNAFSSVTISSEPAGQAADGSEERDLTVDLVEARRLTLIYGFGYQSSRSDKSVTGLSFLKGTRGLVQLTNSNLLGRLYTGSAQFRISENELLGQLSLQDPRPFGEQYPTLVSVLARRLAEKTFRSDRYTALIQTEKRLSHESITYLTYNFERISVFDLEGPIDDIERNRRPILLGRVGVSFLRDSRDSFADPKTGRLTIGSVFLASRFLGGNEAFAKMVVEHNRYYPLKRFRDTVYSVSARVGLATPFGDRETLPISERFFAGGARDLRGFGFEEAGPRQLTSDRTREVPVGGNAMVVVNNELRFPIFRSIGGTVFSDTGNVFRRVRDFRINGLTQTIGVGLRVKTPIGPVRFDLGFLVANKPAGLRSYQGHFTLGQTF